jgi:ribose transport system substrate-binding protein
MPHAQRFLLAACLAALVIPGGCSQKEPIPVDKKPLPKPRIALVMKSLANEFFLTMENGAKEHQKQHAAEYDLLCNGIKDESDVKAQIIIVEQMIAQKASAIVIAPADSKALVPVCKKALDAGLVVVNIDNKFDADVLEEQGIKLPFVGPDNRKGARLAGECLAKQLKAGDKVAILEGAPNAFNGIQRKLGFEDAMKAAGMEIAVSQTANWDMGKARDVVAGMLPSQPDLKAILCANDNMALGAVAALKPSQPILVIGFDNISAVRQLVKDGKILCTVDQHADHLAVFGIQYALDILKTKATPADKETAVDLITVKELK